MLSFFDCETTLGRRGDKKIRNNTVLHRLDFDTFAVELHNTNVLLIHRDGTYTLNSGGYRTVTTKERLNRYGPARVWQKNFQWYVGDFTFFDGIEVNGAGVVLNADAALAR